MPSHRRTRVVEEERARVAAQLQSTLEAAQSVDAPAPDSEFYNQVTLPDEILLQNAERRQVDQRINELKAELLLGNVSKREQERDRLKKRERREERRRRSAPIAVAKDDSYSPMPVHNPAAAALRTSPAAVALGEAALDVVGPPSAKKTPKKGATAPVAIDADRPQMGVSSTPLLLKKGPLAKLKEEM